MYNTTFNLPGKSSGTQGSYTNNFGASATTVKAPKLPSEKTAAPDFAALSGGAIKNNIKNVLSKKYGELDTKRLFDGIADRDVEDNIKIAETTIKTNMDRGLLSKSALAKLPNLRDGLALSYAAANAGNNTAAKRAREAAYTEDDSIFPKVDMPKVTNLLYKSGIDQMIENN